MCVIIDADARDEVFGNADSEAGAYMLEWLTSGPGKLVIGGQLRRELTGSGEFTRWLRTAIRVGRVIDAGDSDVDAGAKALRRGSMCRSNDTHVLALARESKARLLFTNDRKLQEDFRDPRIIRTPRGHVFTTRCGTAITDVHRDLLSRADICAAPAV